MPSRNLSKIQEALNALTDVQLNINELHYYKKHLKKVNHSVSACSSVRKTIESLKNKHTSIVETLKFYGNSYASIDASLASKNNPNYQGISTSKEFYYVAAPEHQKSGWEKFWDQILLGEFSEEVTGPGVVGNIVVSLVAGFFGVDAPLDIRDAAGNFSKGEWGWGILDCVFLLPVIGAFKPAKYVDEVVDITSNIAKNSDEFLDIIEYGDEMIEVGSTITKNGDDVIKSVYKIGDNTFEFSNEIFSGINNVDNIAVALNKGDNLIWITSGESKFILDGDIFKKINKTGEVEIIAHNTKVLPNYSYIKKSDAAYEELRKLFNKTDRPNFLMDLAENNVSDLKKLGLTDVQIDGMKKGIVPDGYEVHHKIPLSDGGSNDPSNLILINKSDHLIFSNYQVSFTNTSIFKQQGYMVVDWIIPEGKIYMP